LRVLYKSNKLEKQCTDERELRRKWPKVEKKLRLRVKALYAVRTLGDLPVEDPGGAWHDLKGDRSGTWSGELSGNWRLIVEPSPNKLHASEVTVVDIEDYHGA
jgi:proteic killer suppression protein